MSCDRPELALEAQQRGRVARVQGLERDRHVALGVDGLVDRAHAALTEDASHGEAPGATEGSALERGVRAAGAHAVALAPARRALGEVLGDAIRLVVIEAPFEICDDQRAVDVAILARGAGAMWVALDGSLSL